MTLHLYKCDDCGNAQFSEVDKGNIYCVSCVRCGPTFHHKVVVKKVVLIGQFNEYEFVKLKGTEKEDE